jgi:L-alanine-DL-glutamate epimerase-like enolase superfamily enzyme
VRSAPTIDAVAVEAYRVPTDRPESDGTLDWSATTMVLTSVTAGGRRGIGYTYSHRAAAELVHDRLAPAVCGLDAFSIRHAWDAMLATIRNVGRPGIAASAIASVDIALWDLKARLLDLPLLHLIGAVRDSVPAYGSGGFTNETDVELSRQLADFIERGLTRVKMKVGSEPGRDPARVATARAAVGPDCELYVDANGAYARKQALALAARFRDCDVTWFEEPVSSDDLAGLALLRDRAPPSIEITAGEYGYDLFYFRHMLDAGAVDVLQADATRCAGFTGFLAAASLCESRGIPLSAHCAPALHAHVGCAATPLRHVECFHDHVRLESLAFDGVPEQSAGALVPDLTRPGLGLELRASDMDRYRV